MRTIMLSIGSTILRLAERATSRGYDDKDPEVIKDTWGAYTKGIQKRPYHPALWLERAEYCLGKYNELACADALKGMVLCDPTNFKHFPESAWVRNNGNGTNNPFPKFRERACCILYNALNALGAYDVAAEYKKGCPKNYRYYNHPLQDDSDDLVPQPKLARHEYPWLDQKFRKRDLSSCKDNIAEFNLVVKKASFAASKHVLGVFSEIDRKPETDSEAILEEEVILVPKAEKLNGNQTAAAMLEHLLDMIFSELGSKVLTLDKLDMLDLPRWDVLTIEYGVVPEFFPFESLIKKITTRLLEAGVLFEPSFDFWRIITLYWRICTNQFDHTSDDGSKHFVALGQLYCLFNHSCDPNAEWGIDDPTDENDEHIGPRIVIDAKKVILPDDEIFISYLDEEDMAKPVADRRDLLRSWFPDDCRCKKCVKEADVPGTPTKMKNKKHVENTALRPRRSPPKRKRASDEYTETPRKARSRKKAKVDDT